MLGLYYLWFSARHMIVIGKIRKMWLDYNTLSDRVGIQNEVDGPQETGGI